LGLKKLRKTILAALLCCCAVLARAAPFEGHVFSFSTGTGLLIGEGNELVYQLGGDTYLSRLDWDLKPLWYGGLTVDFSPRDIMKGPAFFFTLSLWSGIYTGGNGMMHDYDWIGGGSLTDYSEHDVTVDRALVTDFSLGLSYPVGPSMALRLFAGVSYLNFSWTAYDGSFLHTSSTPSRGTYSGPVVSYNQNWLILYPGAALYAEIGPRVQGILSFAASPLFWYAGLDKHLPSTEFYDSAGGSLYVKPRAELSFFPRQGVRLSLIYSFTSIRSARGKTAFRSNPAGAVLSFHELGLMCSLSL
jgi:outer membrane protease